MKKLHYFAFILLLAGIVFGCQPRIHTDFSFSPENPKIGDTVTFTNLSAGGEEWRWTFRHDATDIEAFSPLENPTHIFARPGAHTIILRVDDSDNNVRTRHIMVYDSIPFITRNQETVKLFTDVTFRSVAINRLGLPRTFKWYFSLNARGSSLELSEDGTYKFSTIAEPTVYFVQRGASETVKLHTTVGAQSTFTTEQIPHDVFIVDDAAARSLLMAKQGGEILRQRIFDRGTDDIESIGIDAGAHPFNIVARGQQLFIFDAGTDIQENPNWDTDTNGDGSIRVVNLPSRTVETVITNNGTSSYFGFFNGFVSATHIYWTDRNDFVYRIPVDARNQTFVSGTASPFFVANYNSIGMAQGQFSGGIHFHDGIYYWAKGNGGGGLHRFQRASDGQITPLPARLTDFAIRSFIIDWNADLIYFAATDSPQGAGLFVANVDGTAVQLICDAPMDSALEYITGLAIDRTARRLLWAYRAPAGTEFQSGVKQIRLLGSSRERPETPTFLNYAEGILGITIDVNLTGALPENDI